MTEQKWLASEDPVAMLTYLEQHRWAPYNPPAHEMPLSDRKLRLFDCACARQVWDRLTDDVPCPTCGGDGWVYEDYLGGAGGNDVRQREVRCPDCSGTSRVNRSRRAVEVAERYADGLATEEELVQAALIVQEVGDTDWAAYPAVSTGRCSIPAAFNSVWSVPRRANQLPPPATQAALLRCIVGNPFRPVTLPKGPRCWMCDGEGKHYKMDGVFDCERCDGTGSDACPWLAHNDGAVVKLATVIYDERRFDLLPILADALEEAGCDNADILAHMRGPGPHARGCHVLALLTGRG